MIEILCLTKEQRITRLKGCRGMKSENRETARKGKIYMNQTVKYSKRCSSAELFIRLQASIHAGYSAALSLISLFVSPSNINTAKCWLMSVWFVVTCTIQLNQSLVCIAGSKSLKSRAFISTIYPFFVPQFSKEISNGIST